MIKEISKEIENQILNKKTEIKKEYIPKSLFDNEYLNEPDDMELHFNFGYIYDKNIVPVLPYGEKFLREIEELKQLRNSWKNK